MAAGRTRAPLRAATRPRLAGAPALLGPHGQAAGAEPTCSILVVAKGFRSWTFRAMFKEVYTHIPPCRRLPTAPASTTGLHVLNRHHPTPGEVSVAAICAAWACPADAIYVEAVTTRGRSVFAARWRYVQWLSESTTCRCFSGRAVRQRRPPRSLTRTMSTSWRSTSRRAHYTKEQLMAPLAALMEAPPQPDAPRDRREGLLLRQYPGSQTLGAPQSAPTPPQTHHRPRDKVAAPWFSAARPLHEGHVPLLGEAFAVRNPRPSRWRRHRHVSLAQRRAPSALSLAPR